MSFLHVLAFCAVLSLFYTGVEAVCTDGGATTCNSHGTCASKTCTCTGGWTGDNCNTAPPVCTAGGKECKHGGTCDVTDAKAHKCTCVKGYTGPICETAPPVCTVAGKQCKNGGTCDETDAKAHKCKCVKGYTGPICETDSKSGTDSKSSAGPLKICLTLLLVPFLHVLL